MFKEVIKGTEYTLFTDNVISQIIEQIKKTVIESIESGKNNGHAIIGCLAWNEITLKDGKKTGIYIEYDAKIIYPGVVDAGINYMLLFDNIPDILLDRIIRIKKILGHTD